MRDAYWFTQSQIQHLLTSLSNDIQYKDFSLSQNLLKSILNELGSFQARHDFTESGKSLSAINNLYFSGENRSPIYLNNEEKTLLLQHPLLPIDIQQELAAR